VCRRLPVLTAAVMRGFRVTGIRFLAVLRSMSRGLYKAWKAVLIQGSIIIALFTYVQSQTPLFTVQMNHADKIITVNNDGLPPINVQMYAVRFDLPFYLDERGHLQTPDEITGFGTAGFISKNKTIWPYRQFQVDLKGWRPLSFVDDMAVPKSVYCVVVDVRSILNNQHSLKAVLAPDTKVAASFFGPQNEGAAVGGPYAGVHKLLDLEDRMKQECLRVYENYSISVD
jgi:hypothetical protein